MEINDPQVLAEVSAAFQRYQDAIIANDVAEAGSGFGTETNRVSILSPDGERDDLPLLSKREVADRLLDRIALALDARDADAQTSMS